MSTAMANDNDVLYLIDLLYDMIEGAKGVVLSPDKCIIVRDEALEQLEQLRDELPVELKKAQDLIRARDEYVAGAKREAERIRKEAEAEAKTIVAESRIAQEARERGHEILRRAEDQAKNVVQVTNEYADAVLRPAEEALQMALGEMQESRSRFRTASSEQAAAMRGQLDQQERP